MTRSARSAGFIAAVVVATLLLGAAVIGVAGLGSGGGGSHPASSTVAVPPVSAMPAAAQTPVDTLTQNITMTQATLRSSPDDYQAWATLGLDYVQQAKITVNPAYYPKAKGALATSL